MKRTYYFLLLILVLPLNIYGQSFIISQQLKCDNDLKIYDIKKDINDNIYVAGIFKGTLNGHVSMGQYDIFITKLNNNFDIEWMQTAGSSSIEFDPRIVIDKGDNIFLLGSFRDSCVFGNKYLKSDGNYDIFLAKYSQGGNLLWTKQIAKYPTQQSPTDIDIDNNNNLIITGHYTDSIYFVNQKIVSAGKNNFYAKLDTSGANIWIKNITGNNIASRIANVKVYQNEYYFNGYFKDNMNFDLKTITSNVAGMQDLFLFKTDINGNGMWIRRTYGDNIDVTGSIEGDNYGNVYFTGYFQSSTLSADSTETLLADQTLPHVNDFDIFIFKYNKLGTLQMHKQFGGLGRDYGIDLNINNDILYMSGYFSGDIYFGDNLLSSSSTSDRDMFLTAMDLNANTYNSISIGATDGNDIAAGTIVLNYGDAVMSGYFQSTTLNVGDSIYANGSVGQSNGVIAKYSAPLSVVFSKIKKITCNAGNDGELIATAEFGQKPYTYAWSHDGLLTDSTATGLSAGTYTVTVTDALAATDEATYILTEPNAITFNPVITDVIQCSYSEEGEIDLNMAGGNGNFTYKWLASNGGDGNTYNTEDQTNLATGTYHVTVTDLKKCIADTSIQIAGPAPVTFNGSVVTDSSSLGSGAVNLVYAGGFGDPASFTFNWVGSYTFSQTTEDINNLRPGNYNVTVTDVYACEFDTLFHVLDTTRFYAYISDYKDACQGTINGSATASYFSPDSHTGITYQWDANASSQTTAKAINLAEGRWYKVTITDIENEPDIIFVDSVYISQLVYTFSGQFSVLSTSTLNCFGDNDGFIDLNITSAGIRPYTYNWSNTSTTQDISNLGIGTYGVTITDDNKCGFTVTNYTITQPSAISAVAEIRNKPSCNGDFNGEIMVDRSGGISPYNYQWDDPGYQTTITADGLDAGYYTVTVSDVNNCTAISSINLTEPAAINVAKLINNEICNSDGEGSVSLTVSGGIIPFDYLWSTTTGSGIIPTVKNQSGLTAGKYYFSASDNNNCMHNDSIEITEPPLLQITNEAKLNVSTCKGESTGSITIIASGGTGLLTYTLNPGAIQSNTTGSFTGLGAGNYLVNVEDENSCLVSSGNLGITEPDILVINETDIKNATCNGVNNGNIEIIVTGGAITTDYAYLWSTINGSGLLAGTQDQPSLGAGAYYLTVTDDNACEATGSFTLTQPDTIIINKTIYDLSCSTGNDGVIVITHTGGVLPFSYFWSTTNGSGLEPINRNQGGLGSGTYYLEITDALGCIADVSFVMSTPPAIIIDSENATDASNQTSNDGALTVEAYGGTGILTYTLNPNNISNQTGVFTSILPGDYTVNVKDENYCGPITSNIITVGFPDAIEDLLTNDKIRIYPNPTSDKIFIEIDYVSDYLNIQVLSISGQVLLNKEIKSNQITKEEIDLSNYPKGFYFIRVYNNQFNFNNKILLQ